MKDTNLACRVEWETYKALDLIRADRQVRTNKTTTLSDIVREALNHYIGDTCNEKNNK